MRSWASQKVLERRENFRRPSRLNPYGKLLEAPIPYLSISRRYGNGGARGGGICQTKLIFKLGARKEMLNTLKAQGILTKRPMR
jgi:hypothetical protein